MALTKRSQINRIKAAIEVLKAARGTNAAAVYDQDCMDSCMGAILGNHLVTTGKNPNDFTPFILTSEYYGDATHNVSNGTSSVYSFLYETAHDVDDVCSGDLTKKDWPGTYAVTKYILDNNLGLGLGTSGLELKIAQMCDLVKVDYDGYIFSKCTVTDKMKDKLEAKRAELSARLVQISNETTAITAELDRIDTAISVINAL